MRLQQRVSLSNIKLSTTCKWFNFISRHDLDSCLYSLKQNTFQQAYDNALAQCRNFQVPERYHYQTEQNEKAEEDQEQEEDEEDDDEESTTLNVDQSRSTTPMTLRLKKRKRDNPSFDANSRLSVLSPAVALGASSSSSSFMPMASSFGVRALCDKAKFDIESIEMEARKQESKLQSLATFLPKLESALETVLGVYHLTNRDKETELKALLEEFKLILQS